MRYSSCLVVGVGSVLITLLGYGCGGDQFVASVADAGEGPVAGAPGDAVGGAEAGGTAVGGSTQSGGSGGDAGGPGGPGGNTGGPGGTGGETVGPGGTGGRQGSGGQATGGHGTGGDIVGGGGTGGDGTGGDGTGGDGTGGDGTGGQGTGGDGTGGQGTGGDGTGGDGTGGQGTGGQGTGGQGTGGQGTGGQGTGGSGVGGTPSGGTGGIMVLTEDCLNGEDDDLDQLIDCHDPDCQEGYRCAPLPPDGWMTVGWLGADLTQNCSEDFPSRVGLYDVAQLEAEEAQCSCICDRAEGIVCHAMLYCYAGNECNNETSATEISPDCTPFAVSSTGEIIGSCLASPPFATGGQCAPQVGVAVPSYSWPEAAHACVRESGGRCDDATQCVPVDPDAPDRFCIEHPGDVACPAGYGVATTFEDGSVADTRDCEDCICDAPSGSLCECSGTNQCTVRLYPTGCNGNTPTSFPANGVDCVAISTPEDNSSEVMLTGASVSSEGQCQPSTPDPTGGVSPTGSTTVCCTQ